MVPTFVPPYASSGLPAAVEWVGLTFEADHADARIQLGGAPPGLTFDIVERNDDSLTLELRAAEGSAPIEGRVSVEAETNGRRAMTAPIRITVTRNPNTSSR